MRYSILVASALAAGVLARPRLHARQPGVVYETKLIIQTVVVTITRDYTQPASTSSALSATAIAIPAVTSTPKPEPQPAPKPESSTTSTSMAPDTPGMSQAPMPSYNPPPKPADPVHDHPSGTDQAYLSSGPDYQAAILFHHNAARANHEAAPLSWDTDCEANARIAADRCDFEHFIPQGAGQGQNLFVVSGDAFNVTAGISESWYRGELQDMTPWFGKSSLPHEVFEKVGHLTQMVWKDTTKVGCVSLDCGVAMTVNGKSSDMNKYTVCNYAPSGNWKGQYAAKVAPPFSSAKLVGWAD
jgi:uncharacterized protein YkwD